MNHLTCVINRGEEFFWRP